MTDQDEYQSIPVADARAAVQASGLLEGIDGPHYAVGLPGAFNMQWWMPVFKTSDETPHPDFARVTITRQGQKPREVVISWDEYAAELELNDPAWAEKRSQKPMTIFGAEVERHAYRVVFADVLARLDRPEPAPQSWVRSEKGNPEREWYVELGACQTKGDVDSLWKEAHAAKALTDAKLVEAFGKRNREVPLSLDPKPVEPVADAWEPKPTPAPTLGAVPSPAVVAAKVKPLTVEPVKRPQRDRPQGQRRRGNR